MKQTKYIYKKARVESDHALYTEPDRDCGPNNPGIPLSGTSNGGSTDGGVGTIAGSARAEISINIKLIKNINLRCQVRQDSTRCLRSGSIGGGDGATRGLA